MKEFWKPYTDDLFQRIKLFKQLNLLAGALIVGILGGYGAVGFRALIKVVQDIAWGGWGNPVEFLAGFHWSWILLIPTIGGLLTGLIVYFVSPEAKGHGVPEVIEATVRNNGIIRARVPFAKSLASAISIGTGGSIGREGPIVQIGSAVGSLFGRFTRATKGDVKTFVGCGAAAGIAGTFNAPLAGALFALEIILGDFGVGKFSPIIVSSVAATVVSRHYLGAITAFKMPAYELVSLWEYGLYAVLGLVAGVVGVIFIQTLYKTEDIFNAIPAPQYLRTMLGGVIIGGIALLYPHVLGVGYESIGQVLSGKLLWHVAGVLIAAKLLATSVTLGSGASGGIFAPSLYLGAMTGGLLGTAGGFLMPEGIAPAGAYALVGMAGLVGATTHAPLTAIVIIFEMTNDYRIILPVMLTTIVATLLSMTLQKHSIYTMKLFRKGIDVQQGQDYNVLRTLNVSEVKLHPIVKVEEDTPLHHLMGLMSDSDHSVFFVADSQGDLWGYITLDDLHKTMKNADLLDELVIAADIARPLDFKLTGDDSLARAMELFAEKDIAELPVVEAGDGYRAEKILRSRDVIEEYNLEIFRRDMTSGMASKLNVQSTAGSLVEVTPGFSILERGIPKPLAGQSIGGARLRNRYHIHILLVKSDTPGTGERQEILAADPQYALRESDTILVFGKTSDVRHFGRL